MTVTVQQIPGSDGDTTDSIGIRGGTDATVIGNVGDRLKVDSQNSISGAGSEFSFGVITTAALTEAFITKNTFTEQTTNAQRSIASANANDSAAGTGARQVVLTYYDQTGAGPFTETITLNGTTYVNTVATNICFVDKVVVSSVGSGGVNAGILTLKAATAGGGATICTITAGDNTTLIAHHYVATGKTALITGISCSHSGTTVGSGGVFVLRVKGIGSTDPSLPVSDFFRLYGQSSTTSRVYQSPIRVVGPARLRLSVTPETASSTVYRGAFDLSES